MWRNVLWIAFCFLVRIPTLYFAKLHEACAEHWSQCLNHYFMYVTRRIWHRTTFAVACLMVLDVLVELDRAVLLAKMVILAAMYDSNKFVIVVDVMLLVARFVLAGTRIVPFHRPDAALPVNRAPGVDVHVHYPALPLPYPAPVVNQQMNHPEPLRLLDAEFAGSGRLSPPVPLTPPVPTPIEDEDLFFGLDHQMRIQDFFPDENPYRDELPRRGRNAAPLRIERIPKSTSSRPDLYRKSRCEFRGSAREFAGRGN